MAYERFDADNTTMSKGAARLMTLFIAAGMSLFMSATTLLFNMGLTPDFWLMWTKNWAVSTAIAYPAALVVVPLARRITNRLARLTTAIMDRTSTQ